MIVYLFLHLTAAASLYKWHLLDNSTGLVPTPRSSHSTSVIGRTLYIFGGCEKHMNCYNDLHTYDSTSDVWSRLNSTGSVPSIRGGHVAVTLGDRILLFGGGYQGARYNDLFSYDAVYDHWSQLLPTGITPSARINAAGDLTEDGNLLIVGGYSDDGYENDVWLYNIANNVWRTYNATGEPPTPRELHSLTILNGQAFVFGGFHEGGVSKQLYALDLDIMQWSQPTTDGSLPEGRQGHSAVRQGTYLQVFGGCDYGLETCYADFYALDLTEMWWTKLNSSSPTGRQGSNAAAIGPKIYSYGGCFLQSDCYDDLYRIDTGISCPKNCNGQGSCYSHVCICSGSYSGSDCRVQAQCNNDCNQQGYCDSSGECGCYPGYNGFNCSTVVGCKNNCTDADHGTCQNSGNCRCDAGYSGDDCSSSSESAFLQLSEALIQQITEAESEKISKSALLQTSQPDTPKSKHQSKEPSSFFTIGQEHPACSDNCSLHGHCLGGECECDDGFEGQACELVKKGGELWLVMGLGGAVVLVSLTASCIVFNTARPRSRKPRM